MIPSILNNKTVWYFLILASYSPGSGYSRKEIKDITKLDNASLDKVLRKLIFHKIIKKEKRIIKMNFDNPETGMILDLLEQIKKKLNHPTYDLLLIITEFLHFIEFAEIDSIYLFGSHAKKTTSPNSDIDIAIFSDEKLNLIKEEEKIEEKFGKELQLHYFKTEELKHRNKLIENILKDGVKIL